MPATRPQYLPTPRAPDGSPRPQTEHYRSAARRLRHRHRHDPGELQRSLQRLARAMDRAGSDPGELVGCARLFAIQVSREIEGRVMRYSARCRLLQRADELGLGRFEANLIIASVQHTASHERIAVRPAQEPMDLASGAGGRRAGRHRMGSVDLGILISDFRFLIADLECGDLSPLCFSMPAQASKTKRGQVPALRNHYSPLAAVRNRLMRCCTSP